MYVLFLENKEENWPSFLVSLSWENQIPHYLACTHLRQNHHHHQNYPLTMKNSELKQNLKG